MGVRKPHSTDIAEKLSEVLESGTQHNNFVFVGFRCRFTQPTLTTLTHAEYDTQNWKNDPCRSDRLYLALLKSFPPRPISSEKQLEATQEIIDSLISRPQLTPDEQDYLNVLGSLVREYEELYHALPALHGVELIKALLAELNLEAKDLVPIFNSENSAADILNNKRDFTVTEVQKLAEFFQVSPAAFLEQN